MLIHMTRTYGPEELNEIFEKDDGLCRHCRCELVLENYGSRHDEGGWEVDHSNPRANGGTDNMRNLHALCWECNVDKSSTNAKIFDDEFEKETLGGKVIDGFNAVKNCDDLTLGIGKLVPDLPEDTFGASPKRVKRR